MSVIEETEAALVAQWSLIGRWPKGELHDEDGLLWFETPIRHLPHNGVVRSRLAALTLSSKTVASGATKCAVLARHR